MKTTLLKTIPMLLLVVGGINWGLVQVFDLNVVEKIFGTDTTLTGIVYILVGVAGLLGLYHMIEDFTHRPAH